MVLRILSLIFLLIPTTVLSDVGFKDLKIGSDPSVIEKNCSKIGDIYKCYKFDDLEFKIFLTSKFFLSVDSYRDVIVGNDISSISPFCKPNFKKRGVNWNCYEGVPIIITKDKQQKNVNPSPSPSRAR